jgi:hypothetical protein
MSLTPQLPFASERLQLQNPARQPRGVRLLDFPENAFHLFPAEGPHRRGSDVAQ